eukprot:m.449848 g.449848  ORF g.449848 m.449848 type:complete len:60 (-) comp56905_c2_seq2:27-206(-)
MRAFDFDCWLRLDTSRIVISLLTAHFSLLCTLLLVGSASHHSGPNVRGRELFRVESTCT